MDNDLFDKLSQQGYISNQENEQIKVNEARPISVYWELRFLLYTGITLATTAIGILIYKNIDSISHTAIVIAIATLCILCFGYGLKLSKGYGYQKIISPNSWFDYVILSGALLLVILVGYVQFQYNLFGNRWGLATFIPMIILFITAYYFDHLGVLSLAITNLGAWVGISVSPLSLFLGKNFNDNNLMFAGLALGIFLTVISFISQHKNIKAHFAFTYKNFGLHVLFVSLLALMFSFSDLYLVWFIIIAGVGFVFFKNAVKEKSFYFLVVVFLYEYIALSYVVVQLISLNFDMLPIYFGFIYFILSGIGLIRLLMYYNKILKTNAGLQQN